MTLEAKVLLNEIATAFCDVQRSATSLRQYQLTDLKGMVDDITDEEWKSAGLQRADNKWTDLPDPELEDCGCLLPHMDADDFRYFLPAYMSYSVCNINKEIWGSDIIGSTVFFLTPVPGLLYENTISRFGRLNDDQKNVIVEFLRFVAKNADRFHRPDAVVALEQYWDQNP